MISYFLQPFENQEARCWDQRSQLQRNHVSIERLVGGEVGPAKRWCHQPELPELHLQHGDGDHGRRRRLGMLPEHLLQLGQHVRGRVQDLVQYKRELEPDPRRSLPSPDSEDVGLLWLNQEQKIFWST